MYYNTTGSYNTAVGRSSLVSNTIGNNNTSFGYISLYSNTTGSANNAVGFNALYSNTFKLFIYGVTVSNYFSVSKLALSGNVLGSKIQIDNGNLGIGNTNPGQKLDVAGTTLNRNGNAIGGRTDSTSARFITFNPQASGETGIYTGSYNV